jgi:hypothetical protein
MYAMPWLDKLNAPFPFYLNDDRKNVMFIAVVSLFVVAFLNTFRPYFSHHVLTWGFKLLFGGVTFLVLFINIVLLPKLLPHTFDPVHWTIRKYILITLWHLFVIGFITTLIDQYLIAHERSWWENIKGAYLQVAVTGVVPVIIMSLFLKNNQLRQNLKSALSANQELDKIRSLKKEVPAKPVTTSITLRSETSETLDLHLPELLFIEADDNYSTVFWKNQLGIQKKLLRINLKSVEGQINNSFAIRCHRSYIVNVNAISNITGNTNGYKLQILDTEHIIPVSRPKGKEVIEKIQQLRNVMELS